MAEPEIDAQIDAWVARTREMTGTEVREREAWNTDVTADAVRHFAYGTDDDNPLWTDPEYAARTPHGGLLAPPGYVISVLYPMLHGAPMQAPLSSLIGGVEYRWFRRIRVGDRLRASAVQKEFYEKRNSAGRRLNFVISEITVRDEGDEVVARGTGTMIMAEQVGDELMFERPVHRCDEAQLADIERGYLAERRTGTGPLWFEDVSVGQEIPPVVRGPLTIGDMVCWNAGIGPSYKAGRRGYLDLKKSPHAVAFNRAIGFPVKYSQQHEDANLAAGRGMPGPFDNGVMRFAWTAPLVTNWMGDEGFLERLSVQVRRPAIYGDVTTYSGKVAERSEEHGSVRLEITGTNQAGEVNTRGSAEVVLPRRR